MPCVYDDEAGSWDHQSKGWPETPYTTGKWLLCTKAEIVPYGSYVAVGAKSLGAGTYDYSKANIRVETEALKQKLERAYHGLFIECAHLLLSEEFKEMIIS